MTYSFFDILKLIGSLGLFIYGMKVMSEGIQKVSGYRMRHIMRTMVKNRYLAVFTGFSITSLVQSSSAITVMTVSFVNAGLLSLVESVGVIMGANVGTTITAWLVSYLGLGRFSLASFSLPIIALGLPLLLSKVRSQKHWGELLVGFALLFMGLSQLSHHVPDIQNHPEVLNFLSSYANQGPLSTVIFVVAGLILAIVVQSSSVAMALTMVLCLKGLITFPVAAAMVLGENIGTTLTAELASVVGNVHAKRSARVHTLFNLIGALWLFFVLPLFLKGIESIMLSMGFPSPFYNSQSAVEALPLFHTLFNVANMLLLIGFVPFLVKLASVMVPSRGEKDTIFRLNSIGRALMDTPELSIIEVNKEIVKFAEITKKNYRFLQELFRELEDDAFEKLLQRIKKYEEISDRIEIEISDYLTQISQEELSDSASAQIRNILTITSDLERISDICYNMSVNLERKREQKAYFTPELRNNAERMFGLVDTAMETMIVNIKTLPGQLNLQQTIELEDQMNQLLPELDEAYYINLEKENYKVHTRMFYINIIKDLERMGNHVFNVSQTLQN